MNNVCVIGDAFIDRYIVGYSNRISPEAPVPVMVKTGWFDRIGGAGNVHANMHIPCDYIENDNQGINIKTRYICNGQQVLRMDDEGYIRDQVLIPRNYALAVVSDYNKGNIDDFEYIKSKSSFQIVDAKKPFDFYNGATVVKCNESEFTKFCPYALNQDGVEKARRMYRFHTLIVTRANKPVMVAHDQDYFEIKVPEVEVRDVTGAGDVFLAVFSGIWWQERDIRYSVEVAAKAAAISCKHFGTYALTKEEYESCLY